MSIWANHAHVFPAETRPEGTVEELLRLMDECEIERAVAFAPFGRIKQLDIDQNTWLYDQIKTRSDRLIGFGTIDMSAGNYGSQVDHIKELGFPGIKLHPAAQRFHILSEPLLEVYSRAEEADLFLVFHTGVHWHRLLDFRLVEFDEIAYRFPRLRFSLEHVGGYAFFHEAIAVIQNNSLRQHPGGKGTVYAGLTSVFSPEAPHWYLPPSKIEELIFLVGENRVIFGLDFPYNSAAYIRHAIDTIRHLNISQSAVERILGGNLRQLLGYASDEAVGSPSLTGT